MPTHLKIKERRLALNLSLTELAARLQPYLPGMSRPVLSKIEHGKRAVRADEVPVFAKVLQCNPEDLLDALP